MFKRIKRLLRLRNNSGFTLVEVIIATALLAILIVGMFGFVQPVMRSVRAKEQNARAVMLADTVESYIASSTKYAYYVATFSGVAASDVTAPNTSTLPAIAKAKYTGTDEPYKSAAGTLEGMMKRRNDLNKDNYEIRCIGMRWLTDPKNGAKKLMLTNETVIQENCALDLSKSKLVFETCFYDGLYPVMEYKNFSTKYQEYDEAGNLLFEYAPEKETIAPGLEITMDVYLDPACYSTTEATRTTQNMTFTGAMVANYNILKNIYLRANGENKIITHAEVHSYNDALSAATAADSTAVYTDPDFGQTYYPDTYIYYLVRKTKTQGGAGGGTTSTPTPDA